MEGTYQINRTKFGSFEICVVETEMGHAVIHEDSSTITISYYTYDGWETTHKYSCGDEPWRNDDELMAGICIVLGTEEQIELWERKRIG